MVAEACGKSFGLCLLPKGMAPDVLGIHTLCFHCGLWHSLSPLRTVRPHESDGSHIMGHIVTESMCMKSIGMRTQRPSGATLVWMAVHNAKSFHVALLG